MLNGNQLITWFISTEKGEGKGRENAFSACCEYTVSSHPALWYSLHASKSKSTTWEVFQVHFYKEEALARTQEALNTVLVIYCIISASIVRTLQESLATTNNGKFEIWYTILAQFQWTIFPWRLVVLLSSIKWKILRKMRAFTGIRLDSERSSVYDDLC